MVIVNKRRITGKRQRQQAQVSQAFSWKDIPPVHWCGHYFYPNSKIVIPDGASCCWRHWIGLPTRWGQRHPYYSWQDIVIGEFYKYDYFWMKKPPKIGASETYLHLAMHQACINHEWKGGQVAIVVGTTGLKEGEEMIARCKTALKARGIPIDEGYNTKTEFTLNSVKFRAHPADNVDAIRSKPNMRLIIVDEGAFFRQKDQGIVRAAFEHYIGGSGTKIVLVSTAGDAPEGFMYDIENEPDVSNGGVYHHYTFDFKTGLEVHPESKTSLYNHQLIQEAQKLPSFARNYLGMWGHGSGDIFSLSALDSISKHPYDIYKLPRATRVLSVDPGYGSSDSALVGMQEHEGLAYVIQADAIKRPSDSELLAKIDEAIKEHGYTIIQIDAHWSGLIKEFSSKITTIPIDFREKGQMMTHSADQRVSAQTVRIHPDFIELVQQLKAARKNDKGTVDKKLGKFDLYDGFIMGLDYFEGGMGWSFLPA